MRGCVCGATHAHHQPHSCPHLLALTLEAPHEHVHLAHGVLVLAKHPRPHVRLHLLEARVGLEVALAALLADPGGRRR